MNATDGSLKRHAGALSWVVQVGASTGAKIGFHGVPTSPQRANANQAAATDLASVIILANELRAALVEKGLMQGGTHQERALVTIDIAILHKAEWIENRSPRPTTPCRPAIFRRCRAERRCEKSGRGRICQSGALFLN